MVHESECFMNVWTSKNIKNDAGCESLFDTKLTPLTQSNSWNAEKLTFIGS